MIVYSPEEKKLALAIVRGVEGTKTSTEIVLGAMALIVAWIVSDKVNDDDKMRFYQFFNDRLANVMKQVDKREKK
jgi:hypothetical protein